MQDFLSAVAGVLAGVAVLNIVPLVLGSRWRFGWYRKPDTAWQAEMWSYYVGRKDS